MKHLVSSFQKHTGLRGVHFYDEEACNFLPWNDVFTFIKTIETRETSGSDSFVDKLTESLANYNPDKEFLAVRQKGDIISVELYARAQLG